jgi:hypothetical protein
MKTKAKISEKELADALIAVLTQDGWDCYAEVQIESYGDRADVVATQNGLIWVFECKLTPNMDVLGQALRWVGRAHFVSICTPYGACSPSSNRGRFITDWIKRHGIGWYVLDVKAVERAIADPRRHSDGRLTGHAARHFVDLNPRLNRSAHRNAMKILTNLHSDMNNYNAGAGGEAYSTPFKRTMLSIDQHLKVVGSAELGQLIDSIKHHYNTKSSAISCIGKVVRSMKDKYRTEGSGRAMKVYWQEAVTNE